MRLLKHIPGMSDTTEIIILSVVVVLVLGFVIVRDILNPSARRKITRRDLLKVFLALLAFFWFFRLVAPL